MRRKSRIPSQEMIDSTPKAEESRRLLKRFGATGAIALLAAGGVAGCAPGKESPAPDTVTVTHTGEDSPIAVDSTFESHNDITMYTSPEQAKQQELEKQVRDYSIDVAKTIIDDILDSSASKTTNEYRGSYVGNKSPDRPAEVPEAFISYSHDRDSIYVSLAQVQGVETGALMEGFESLDEEIGITTVSMSFDVQEENAIHSIPRQLTLDDFRAAFEDKDSIQLSKLEGKWYEHGIPGEREYTLMFGDDGISTTVFEDTPTTEERINAIPGVNDASQINRIFQIANSSLDAIKDQINRIP